MRFYLKYDLRAPGFGPPAEELYQACIEQCAWAEQHGFTGVRFHEHHASEDGYLPSPIVMGGVVAGVTARLAIRFSVIVLPLHEPLRIAEDLAVLDIASRGRVELVVGAGYVPYEFTMFGRDVGDRVALVERNVRILRAAWTGEEFDIDGRPARIRPRPYRGRSIPIALGGSSVRAARQAARIADGFDPVPRRFLDAYLRECAAFGKDPGWYPGPGHELRLLHVATDPDAAWARIRRYAAHENEAYTRLGASAGSGFRPAPDPDELRASGAYRIVTPKECVELLRGLGPDADVQLHPLVGGLDPEVAWESLHLFYAEVMPQLAEENVA
jgi:alkanesulfonate monooxygenase SsuD/methylene tetrahydromethanopterin reductase-like flavin-dependent oxidoreductase (luciferase family)